MTEPRLDIDWRVFFSLVGLLALIGTGCDRGGSKRDAQYQRLRGTWEVRDVRQGRINYGEQDVALTFREDEGGRTYRLRHAASGDTSVVRGAVDVLASNRLRLSGGFSHPLVWTFTFDEPDELNDTVRFYLESNWDGSSQSFLDAVGLSGTAQRVEMDLEYQ